MNSRTSPANGCVSDSRPPHDTSHNTSNTRSGLGGTSFPPYPTGDGKLDELARREQILAVQVKAHRFCISQLADDRARFEAERDAATARMAEAAMARAREELAQERQALTQWKTNESAALEQQHAELVRRDAELQEFRLHLEAEQQRILSSPPPASTSTRAPMPGADAAPLLGELAKKAVDFAAMVDVVTDMQRQLAEARSTHEAMNKRHADALQQREDALTEREKDDAERFAAAEAQLAMERQQLLEAKQEVARMEQEYKERRTELVRRQAEVSSAEQENVAARQEAMSLLESAERTREELDAAAAKLKIENETLTRAKGAQLKAVNELEQRSRTLAEQEHALEDTRKQMAKEAEEVRLHAIELDQLRTQLEGQRAGLKVDESAFEQRVAAFDERQKKLRDSLSNLLG